MSIADRIDDSSRGERKSRQSLWRSTITCTVWLMRYFAFIITYATFPISRLVYKSVQNRCTNVKHILCIFLPVTGFFSIFYWYTERRAEQETRSRVEDKSSKGIKVEENTSHSIYSKVILCKLLRNCGQIFLIDWKKKRRKNNTKTIHRTFRLNRATFVLHVKA